jgi:4-hydroxy-2-oxoheptanedioate aldolase
MQPQPAKSFKQRMRDGDKLYGFFVGPPSPATVEMVGYAGYDFVIIDREHGPAGIETLENLCRAADASGIATIVRLPSASTADILHALDAGATGILVPHVADAAAARHIVDNANYPPFGSRGISTLSRAGRYGLSNSAEYLANRRDHIVVMALIEDESALEQVDAIARTEGLDAVFVGPSDLAASMGHVGNAKHPDVAAALARIWQQLAAVPSIAVATATRSPQDVEQLVRENVRLFCFNTTSMLAGALSKLRGELP